MEASEVPLALRTVMQCGDRENPRPAVQRHVRSGLLLTLMSVDKLSNPAVPRSQMAI